ncbi:MAG: hypothetical protein ACKOW5_03815 [Actinomycetales bacterium]
MFVSVARLDPGLNAWMDATDVAAEGTTQLVIRGADWQRTFVVQTTQVNTMVLVGHDPQAELAASQRPVAEETAFLAGQPRRRRSSTRTILMWTAIAVIWLGVLGAGAALLMMESSR